MNIAAQVRKEWQALPNDWANLLTRRLQALAELAEIHPVGHAREGPVRLLLRMDPLEVAYEVDRDHQLLTVTGFSTQPSTAEESEPDEDPISSRAG